MREGLQAVRRTLLVTLAFSVIGIVLALPSLDDATYLRVLGELERFEATFDREALEKRVVEAVRSASRTPASQLAERIEGPGVPAVQGDAEAALEGEPEVELATLGAVESLGAPEVSFAALKPDPAQLGMALRWRLARRPTDQGYVLEALAWRPGGASEETVAADQQVEPARQQALAARREFVRAKAVNERTVERFAYLRKLRRVPRKRINKAWRARVEAREAVREAKQELDRARERYHELAEGAESWSPQGEGPSEGYGVARVTVRAVGQKAFNLSVPVALERKEVVIAPVVSGAFEKAREADIWPRIEKLDVEAALRHVRGLLSWHAGTFGQTLLQALPVLLGVLIVLLIVQCKRALRPANPFKPQELPPKTVLISPAVDAALVVACPVILTVLCTWSLLVTSALPAVALLAGLASVGAAIWCRGLLVQVYDLREDIHRTSLPPPGPGGKKSRTASAN